MTSRSVWIRRAPVLPALLLALGAAVVPPVAAVAAARTTPVTGCAALGEGAAGPAVVRLQKLLKTTADGGFGPHTRAALKRWQKAHHVPATGVVDAATWAALPTKVARAACGAPVHGSGVTASCAALSVGSRGVAVEVLQRAVGASVDGDFGPRTRASLEAAQRRHRLAPSGVTSAATWKALGLSGTPACSPASAAATPPTAAPPSDAAAQAKVRAEVLRLAATLRSRTGVSHSKIALKALAFAQSQTGKPYVWGGTGPKGYDCSGLTMTSYLDSGIAIPRVAAAQYAGAGTAVSLADAKQGDLLFYASDLTKPSTVYHVVMYAGGGRVIDAPHTGAEVGTRALWTTDLLPIAVRPAKKLALPLRPGATGWSVEQLQQALDRHGARLAVDGGFGPKTEQTVKAWQAAHRLSASGVVHVSTWLTF